MRQRQRGWIGVHLFDTAGAGAFGGAARAGGSLDELLTGLVRPLTGELAAGGLVRRWFFQRGWVGGPHLRLVLLPTSVSRAQETGDAAADAAHDASPEPTRDAARDTAREPGPDAGAGAELGDDAGAGTGAEAGPAAPVVEEIRRVVRHRAHRFAAAPRPGRHRAPYATARHGGAPRQAVTFTAWRDGHQPAAVDEHVAFCSRMALRLVSAGLPPGRREDAALSLILASWFTAEADPERLAEQPFVRAAARPAPVAREARPGGPLANEPAGDSTMDEAVVRWSASLAELDEALRATGLPSHEVAATLDGCARMACNRLGVEPDTERGLRRLAADAVAEFAA
ncbi:lantibiotic dehydratase C-terminal domain-containing protein [Streptomyces sp. 4N509B]|uniref:lantibiotic dehydratase C-terminal domain-containing protein n=1 Tax=Streptomyces sp. 4N509B TaxID=3457413 RepID=UPI003FD37CD7